jgi:hypothetical protein
LRAADQPGKTTYSFVKAAIGMVKDKLVGGEREGPRPETLIRVIFQLSELKDDSWVRSFTRVFFCLLRLAIQKPVIFEQADLEEELSGRVSPKLIQSKLAEKRGTLTMTKNMALDLTKLAFETVKDSVVRYALVAPIELLRGSSIVKRFAPPLALLAEQSLNRYHQSTHAALYRKQEYYLAKLPNEKQLRELQESELDVHVIERYIDYLYRPQMRVSDAEISNLLNYWEIRRKISWLESADNVAKHKQELKSLHPKFRKLPDLLHPQSGLFATLINDLRASRTQDEQSELTDAEVILANFAGWAHSLQGQVSPPQPVFLESSADRLHAVLLDTDGSLRLVGAGEVKRLFVHTSPEQQPQVLEHAEEARVTLIEMALGMALEPFQRRTVIETCRERRKNSITKEQALKRLTSIGIPAGPLLGAPGCHGLLDSRLLGA